MNDPEIVRISSNENPMCSCKGALEPMAKSAPLALCYSPIGGDHDFVKTVAAIEDVPEDHIMRSLVQAIRCIAASAQIRDRATRSSCQASPL